jgi:single-stranded-DNA-specific exonuclease
VLAAALRSLGDDDPGPAVVIAGDGWPSGVVGIVAAKLVERYRRPAFVIAVDPATGVGRGSARSYGGVDLYQALGACAPMLERYGGHAAAAGLTVRASEVARLKDALGEAILARGSGPVASAAVADATVELGALDEDTVRELLSLAPFGQDNPPPRLVCRGVTVKASRRVGDGSHLKLELADGGGALRGAIGFGLGARDPGAGAMVDVVFTPSVSSWQGRTRVELELHELHPAGQ